MEFEEILKEINEIFCRILNTPSIQLTKDTTAGDVDEWDSLSNIKLIAEVEKHFAITFKLREILKLKNVGELCINVKNKIAQ